MPGQTPSPERHVAFVANGLQFPQGMAGTQRVKLLGRGLVAYGDRVTVLTLQGTEQPDKVVNTEARGVSKGVHFEYSCGTTISSRSYLVRRWRDLRGYAGAMWRLWRMKRAGQLDFVILYTRMMLVVSVFSAWCRFLKVPVILELCEWPPALLDAGHGTPAGAKRFSDHAIAKSDAVIPISSCIEEIVRDYCRQRNIQRPLILLPIIVDSAEYQAATEVGLYVTMCASLYYMNMHKLVIESCSELKCRGVSCRVKILCGYSTPERRAKVEDLARQNDVADAVEVLGYVDDDELKHLYTSSRILLVPLEPGAHSATRFPQKLAEYLASGRPVATTAVGDIPHYLRDGVSALFAADFTPQALADCLQKALQNPSFADAVGLAGRKVAQEQFDYLPLGRRLGEFIETLVSDKETPRG
ncbi:MAG: glycosyltransferase family 4 protein [Planctomycetota bacterium]